METRTRDLTDQVTGFRTVFSTVENYLPGTLEVHLNGVRQRRGVHFVESGAHELTMAEAPRAGDSLAVQYEQLDATVPTFPLVVPAGIDPRRP